MNTKDTRTTPLERSDQAYWSPSSVIRRLERRALHSQKLAPEEVELLQEMARDESQPLTARLARILLDPDLDDPQAASFRAERLAVTMERMLEE